MSDHSITAAPNRLGPLAWLALILIGLAVYGPGLLATPVVDRDEARFAQASRQMLESVALAEGERDPSLHAGGWSAPYVGDRPRLTKPPLIYWLQAASAGALTGFEPGRDAIWMYRLPSAVAAIVTVLITGWLGSRMGGAAVGLLAGAMLAVCPLFAWEARQARADQVMVACTALAMAGLWIVESSGPARARRLGVIALCLGVALGVLAKGPVTPMVVVLSWLSRRAFRLPCRVSGPVIALSLAAAVALALPWLVALADRVGWATLAQTWFDEVIGRSASPKEGHAGPPGYHLVLLAALFWPGSLLTAWGVWRGVRASWRRRGTPTQVTPDAFLLAWLLPSWLVFELVSTKLPHYTMPLYPAVSLISARGLVYVARLARTGSAPKLGLGLPIWTLIGAVWLIAATIAIGWPGWADAARWPAPEARMALTGVLAAVGLVFLIEATRRAQARRWIAAHAVAIVSLVLWHAAVGGRLLPNHHDAWITERIERTLTDAGWRPGERVDAIGYHEDSLAFATRGRLQRIDAAIQATSDYLVMPVSIEPPTAWTSAGHVEGFNYSKGEWERLAVLRRDSRAAP